MMQAAEVLAPLVGVVLACLTLSLARATFYRWRARENSPQMPRERKPSVRALSPAERQNVLDTLNSERFVDLAPSQVYASLLEEGQYLCSIRTMYRILEENKMVRERRNQRRHPKYKKPELLATGPNQLWSWDITKLKGPAKWTYYYLYVLLDVFSRYVVGWMVAPRESAELGQQLITESIAKQGVCPTSLTIHSDRGSPMTAKSTALLMAELGVTKSHSRPYVSNDNPFSESHFKTFKYRPGFPDRFGSMPDSRVLCQAFFPWYNHEHRHSSLALFTPADVHYGRVEEKAWLRQEALDAAYARHPERFVRKPPSVSRPPDEVWINPPNGLSSQPQVLVPTHHSPPSVPASPAPHETALTGTAVGSWGVGGPGGGEASLLTGPDRHLLGAAVSELVNLP